MEDQETFANKEIFRIYNEAFSMVLNNEITSKDSKRIRSIIDKVIKLQNKATKEAKKAKDATLFDKYEPEAIELVKEAQAILDGLKSDKESQTMGNKTNQPFASFSAEEKLKKLITNYKKQKKAFNKYQKDGDKEAFNLAELEIAKELESWGIEVEYED